MYEELENLHLYARSHNGLYTLFNFGLNFVLQRGEDEGVFQVWEPMKMEKKPKNSLGPSVRGDEQPIDIKLSVCKDFGNGSNRTGKRKISWQDQVALRV